MHKCGNGAPFPDPRWLIHLLGDGFGWSLIPMGLLTKTKPSPLGTWDGYGTLLSISSIHEFPGHMTCGLEVIERCVYDKNPNSQLRSRPLRSLSPPDPSCHSPHNAHMHAYVKIPIKSFTFLLHRMPTPSFPQGWGNRWLFATRWGWGW